MKAIRIHHFGNPNELKIEDAPEPEITSNQILVSVKDAGVNPIDWKIRANFYHSLNDDQLPLTMGQDYAGVVKRTGRDVTLFKPEDRIFGFALTGSYVETAITDESSSAMIPDAVDFVTAAAIPTAGLTAWQVVNDTARVSRNMKVLVQGAAGGVGSFAVQICKWLGARVVATASREDFKYLEDIGADELIDYKTEKFEERVRGADVILDFVGGDVTKRSMDCVRRGGILVSTTHTVNEGEAEARGFLGVNFMMKRDGGELSALASLVERRIVKPRVSRIMPLAEARSAQESLQFGKAHGKIILAVGPAPI